MPSPGSAADLNPEQREQLNTNELIKAARSDPADVFAAKVRREAERIKGDNGLADTRRKQAASTWRHWYDERSGMGTIHAEFDPERYEAIVNSVEAQLDSPRQPGWIQQDARPGGDGGLRAADRRGRSERRAAESQRDRRLGYLHVRLPRRLGA